MKGAFMMKKILSLWLVVFVLMSLVVPVSFAEDYVVLSVDTWVDVSIVEGQSTWCRFVPSETRVYTIRSRDAVEVDPVATLYDADMQAIGSGDDADGVNFEISMELIAGQTYYLEACDFNLDQSGSYQICVDVAMPTDVFFDEYGIEIFAGESYAIKAHVYPEDANTHLTWTSSDASIASVDENGTVTGLSEGEVNITAETLNGLIDTCAVTVYPVHDTLTLNQTRRVFITSDAESKERTYKITPQESGYYAFYSSGIVCETEGKEIDPRAYLYGATRYELAYDDSGEGVCFRATCVLTAGETYYLRVVLYDPDSAGEGYFDVTMEAIPLPEEMKIDCGDLTMDQGSNMDIYVTYFPANAFQEDYEVTSSDPSIVYVEGKTIFAKAAGEAKITATTASGISDTITVTVIGLEAIEPNKICTLESTDDYGTVEKKVIFRPTEAGLYTLSSTRTVGEEITAKITVYDEYGELRYSEPGTASVSLTYEFEAGKTYFYAMKMNYRDVGSVMDFTLTKTEDKNIPQAGVNVTYDIAIDNPGDGVYHVFRPTYTGLYAIYSLPTDENNAIDTKLRVYNEKWELFYVNDDGGEQSQFRMEEEFAAGETYYLKSFIYAGNQAGSFTMHIAPLFTMDIQARISEDETKIELESSISDAQSKVYAAFYDENGRCLGVKTASPADTSVDIPQNANGFRACRLFGMNTSLQPVCRQTIILPQ